MQITRFDDGGFVVHKIDQHGDNRVSAWFDADGYPIDAERIIGNRTYYVSRTGPTWDRCREVGRMFAKKIASV
jgi:hypothetical protein